DDQNRRHQRAASDAREADDQAQAETRHRELPGHDAERVIPAPTVSFVVSSISTNAPVVRFSSYGSTHSGSESRRCTTPMAFNPSWSGAGTSSIVWTSTRETSWSAIARTER